VVEATDIPKVLYSSKNTFSSLMIMEPASTSEMLLNFNQTIRRHILEDRSTYFFNICHPEVFHTYINIQ